jgi:hypothetical protein
MAPCVFKAFTSARLGWESKVSNSGSGDMCVRVVISARPGWDGQWIETRGWHHMSSRSSPLRPPGVGWAMDSVPGVAPYVCIVLASGRLRKGSLGGMRKGSNYENDV